MVGRWGMSEAIGPLAVTDGREEGPLLPGASPVAPATQEMVDAETKRIVEQAEREVVELLERERSRLDALAQALLERETLDQADAYSVAGADASGDPAPADQTPSRGRDGLRTLGGRSARATMPP
jgi:cell division protease FtsH